MEGLSSNIPPSLFRYKIGSFSSFSTSSIERFESCEFDAGDYKWRLSFYPNGNKEKGGKDHISLYLMLANSSSFDPNKEILVSFHLFALDHIREKYWSVQEVSRFNAQKFESGFDKFLSIGIFNDPSKGYLVEDTCMFGVEIFSIVSVAKGNCLSGNQNPLPFTYTWKIESFSKLVNKSYSDTFTAGGHKWKMLLFPKGHLKQKGKGLSLYLALVNPENLDPGKKVDVEFKFRLMDQVGNEHWEEGPTTEGLDMETSDWGFTAFIPFGDFNKTSTGYLVKDTCILQAEIITVKDSVADKK
ncbi:hypothetical protein ACHQM5_008743 [Ranunculus cassubicifolius]